MNVIIHGPQGCGKTRNSVALAKHFKCARVVDFHDLTGNSIPAGTLVLANDPGDEAGIVGDALVLSFSDAMQQAGIPLARSSFETLDRASIPLSPIYFTDDYPRPGCSLSVDVLADSYVMRCWGPKGKCLEVYPVKTACQLGRMVEEWCDGKAPQLHCAPDQTSSGSSVTE